MRNRSGMDWFFRRVFPVLFMSIFVIVIAVFVIQIVVIGTAGYHLITDPEGTANTVGTVIGEVVRPIADAVQGQ